MFVFLQSFYQTKLFLPKSTRSKPRKHPSPRCTNLSKSILTAKIPRASGKAVNKCPALGYSTPGAASAKSAQVTLCGSQNLSFQNQAEKAAMFLVSPTPQMLNY